LAETATYVIVAV